MNVSTYIASLVQYGLDHGLVDFTDVTFIKNQLLMDLFLDGCEDAAPVEMPLEEILKGLLDDAVARGVCRDDITSRELLDTRLMGVLTPLPREVWQMFADLYVQSPEKATDWFYRFSQDTDYIRRYRMGKDVRWKTATAYGDLDIVINLSNPEKDPKAIAAAKNAPQVGYPKCLLCPENEGYAGRANHPARQNHRIVPIKLGGENWYLQYSPYAFFNEHCIALSAAHVPLKINRAAFEKLLDFITVFPHYFIGSDADLPVVGGLIMNHEHFLGGRCCLPIEKAHVEKEITFRGYEDVQAGILRWPVSVIRLDSPDKARLVDLADRILTAWRGYSDEGAFLFAQTDGEIHNTITPIARRRGQNYELDLALRNNITTPEHPQGVFHPHSELHHIKRVNIGLVEVMGLAVLPARLQSKLSAIEGAIQDGRDIAADPGLAAHAPWVAELKNRHTFTAENTAGILKEEVGRAFAQMLEYAGVYKCTAEGRAAFLAFVDAVNAEN